MKAEDFGACYSCEHWAFREGDERHGEVLPGEHPLYRSWGDCPRYGIVQGHNTCDEYTAQREPRCNTCDRPLPEDSLRVRCLPCSAKAKERERTR